VLTRFKNVLRHAGVKVGGSGFYTLYASTG